VRQIKFPIKPGDRGYGEPLRLMSTVVIWLFIAVVANVVSITFLEGCAGVLPDDPSSYTLIDQLFK
jgi:hypothetical protein